MTDSRKTHAHPSKDAGSSAQPEKKTNRQTLNELLTSQHLKMREVSKQGGTDYIVYEDVKGQNFKEVYAWGYADDDPEEQETAFKEILAVLHSVHQDVQKPLELTGKYSDQVAELRYFARRNGFNISWLLLENDGVFEHRFGVKHKKSGQTRQTDTFKSESEALSAAIKLVEEGCKKKFESSSHKEAKAIAAKAKKDVESGKIQVVKRKKKDDDDNGATQSTHDTKRRRDGGHGDGK